MTTTTEETDARPAHAEAPELLMPAEVAAMFRVDKNTVRRWAIAGKLTPVTTPGGHRRYRTEEVLALRGSSTTEPELLNRTQVAQLLQVQPGTVTAWAKDGRLTAIDTPGGHHRYRADEVRALLAAKPTGSPAVTG